MTLADNPHGTDVVDWSAALEYAGGEEKLLGELCLIFLDEAPLRMREIESGLASSDAKLFHRGAHTLKNILIMFGATRVADLAYELETAGREQRLAGTEPLVRQLQPELDAVIEAVRSRASAGG